MRLQMVFLAAALGLSTAAGAAAEEGAVTGSVTVISDYLSRGLPQTNGEAAAQGALYYKNFGFTAGSWISNTKVNGVGEAEMDPSVRYDYALHDKASVGIGWTAFLYSRVQRANTVEYGLFATLWDFSLSAGYTGDYYGTKSKSFYYNVARAVEVWGKQKLSLALSAGLTTFSDQEKALMKNFFDYRASLQKTIENVFDVGLFYSGTNRKDLGEVRFKDTAFGAFVGRSF